MRKHILCIIIIISSGCSVVSTKKFDITNTELKNNIDKEDRKTKNKITDRVYNNSYNRTLTTWNTSFNELNIPTTLGNAHVIVSGPEHAEVLVLLHGMNASSTMWYPNIKALSGKYRIYAIDNLLEPGKSDVKSEVKGIDYLIEWYSEIFDKLKLNKITLIGASKGGWLSMKIALKEQPRVVRLILISPLQTFMQIPVGSEILNTLAFGIAPSRKRLQKAMESMSTHPERIERSFVEQFYLATKKGKIDRLLFQITPFTIEETKSLNIPVLLLVGEKDIINNEKTVEKAKKMLPVCETAIIKDAGHFLSMDQSEDVNNTILMFLQAYDEFSDTVI